MVYKSRGRGLVNRNSNDKEAVIISLLIVARW